MAKKIELQTAKGVRDAGAEELIVRNKLISKMIKIFEKYGFDPLETPLIERLDVLNVKFGAGEDSDVAKEIFRFKDQGDRDLGLRFELTLSMCRHVAMNPTIKLPFKRYEIGRVYRDGPIKLGRTREFYQCDVDIVGSKRMLADAECIRLALDVFNALGLDAYIEVNNRKLLNGILEYAGVTENKRELTIITLDKLSKIGVQGVSDELKERGINITSIKKIIELLAVLKLEGNILDNIKELKKLISNDIGKEGIKEIEELFSYFTKKEKENIKFNSSLARGLSYYTGTVFEGFLRDSEITSSICGGGRYDEMIQMLMQSKDALPAVGISFGLVPIMEEIKRKQTDFKKTVTQIYVVAIGDTAVDAIKIASDIRKAGLNCEVDLMNRNISKNLKYANGKQIPFVLFVGEKELKSGKLKLRDMKSGKEKNIASKNLIKDVKSSMSN